ncbi:MAG: DUF4268 domain-containing protein [Chloroflexota bacterium]|nr:DUF4268 domain-containing protein [Chloroflexota bacterium]
MLKTNIGKLQRVPLREVWPHEAMDFTRWLHENIEILNEATGVNLSSIEREQSAGDFHVDILAEDESGNPVIIENQLEKSDHDHLGKLVTYLTALDAKIAIWIVSEPRPEHINAITWLNEAAPTSFYLLQVEAVKIGESPPAPLLTRIVGPSQESREIGQKKKEWVEREKLRYKFWSQLLERARKKTSLHANISPNQHNWIGTGAGKSGLSLNYVIRQNDSQTELYIDRGKDSQEENLSIFTALQASQDEIENAFGDSLGWEPLEGRRACRIAKYLDRGGYRSPEEEWPEIHAEMIDAMIRLEKALTPYIERLDV